MTKTEKIQRQIRLIEKKFFKKIGLIRLLTKDAADLLNKKTALLMWLEKAN